MRINKFTNKRCVIAILSIITLGYTQFTFADPTSIGVGVGWSNSPYKSYSASFYPVPHIDYDNGLFFIDDLSAGFYLYNENDQSISLGARYLSNEFKPHDSDNHRLKQLDTRHTTVLAEIEYSIVTDWGGFSTSIAADVLNESNSILFNADYTLPYIQGDLIIAPTIGVSWANSKHNNYYYGVSNKESLRSGLHHFSANNSFTPYLEVAAQYTLTDNIASFGGIHIEKLTGDAADSPMVDKSILTSVYMGLSYKF